MESTTRRPAVRQVRPQQRHARRQSANPADRGADRPRLDGHRDGRPPRGRARRRLGGGRARLGTQPSRGHPTLVGARTLEQLRSNLSSLETTLAPEQLAALERAVDTVPQLPSRRDHRDGANVRLRWGDRGRHRAPSVAAATHQLGPLLTPRHDRAHLTRQWLMPRAAPQPDRGGETPRGVTSAPFRECRSLRSPIVWTASELLRALSRLSVERCPAGAGKAALLDRSTLDRGCDVGGGQRPARHRLRGDAVRRAAKARPDCPRDR